MKIEAGTLIGGRYRVERELGRGGMGAVYVAFDTRFDKQVAVKVTHAGGGAHDVLMARFKREAKISNELGSESGFVRAFDWGEVPPAGLFLAMDLVEDASPLDLTSGSLEERLLRLKAAAELVQRAHEQGIVHRDLKPANVLQDGAGEIHLTDFGIAKILADDGSGDVVSGGLTQSGVGMGTPHYMSPEQCADAKTVDARCDVFALGVMLFRALTGKHPFPGSSLTEIMRKHIAVEAGTQTAPRPRDHWPEIPAALDELCARAIHVDPEQRLGSVAELVAGLEDPIGGAPTVQVPAPEAASAPTAITPPPPAPDESDLSTGALAPEAPTVPPSARAEPKPSQKKSWLPKLVGLGLIVALNVGGYQLFKGSWGTPAPDPPMKGVVVPTYSASEPESPKVGLSKGAPVLRVRRLDDACFVGQLTGIGVKVTAEGPVTIEGPFTPSTTDVVSGEEPNLEEGPIQGVAGTQTWTYVAVDGKGRRSLPSSVQVEVKPPALTVRRLDTASFGDDSASLEFQVDAGDEVQVVDAASGDGVFTIRPGETEVLAEVVRGEAGPQRWRYYAEDAAGNRSETVEVPYTVNPPKLRVRRLDAANTPNAITRVEFDAPGGGDLQIVVAGEGREFTLPANGRPGFTEFELPDVPGTVTWSFVAVDAYTNRSQPVELTIEVKAEGGGPELAPVNRMPGYAKLIERAKQIPGLSHVGAREFRSGGQAYRIARFLHERTGLTFHLLPGGSYRAGGKKGHVGKREDEIVPHTVEIEPLLVAATECTQDAWQRVMGKLPPTSGDPKAPVYNVTWREAIAFCERLGLRLPSELEWEYACRGGTSWTYCFGDDKKALLDYAEFEGNNERGAKPVGGRLPNAFGLYDMHGNVWEWCRDAYVSLRKPGPQIVLDPLCEYRVMRGGSWNSTAPWCRSAHRSLSKPAEGAANIGFRPVISLP